MRKIKKRKGAPATTHMFRDYRNKVAYAECGAVLDDRDVTLKACEINCTKCKKSAAFLRAAKNPFYGVVEEAITEQIEGRAKKTPVNKAMKKVAKATAKFILDRVKEWSPFDDNPVIHGEAARTGAAASKRAMKKKFDEDWSPFD